MLNIHYAYIKREIIKFFVSMHNDFFYHILMKEDMEFY